MNFTQHEIQILDDISKQLQINAHLRIHVATLISQYQISQTTVTRAYKHLYNKTPQQHRLEVTMQYARQQIQAGEQIKNIAFQMGYAKASNFSRAFKKTLGALPSKFTPC
jgi:AraC-like DNA-binding protein